MKKNILLLLTFLLPLFSFQLHSQIFGFDLQLSQNPNIGLKVFVYPNTQKVQILDGNTTIGIFNYTSWCANNDGVILVEGGTFGQQRSFGNQFIIDIAEGKYGHSITLSKDMAMITESNSAALTFIPANNNKYTNDLNSLRNYILGRNNTSTPSTIKIEPYQSTAVRDIRKKKDLTFDDIFYLGRETSTLKEFRRYYPFEHGAINIGSSHTLYGHPVSDYNFSKDYKDLWHISGRVYFGETNSKSAIEEANKFMQDIYAYLIKRGRNVTMTMGGNSSYPDCYLLKFDEGPGREIGVVNGGLYTNRNGEAAWGVVIHMSFNFK